MHATASSHHAAIISQFACVLDTMFKRIVVLIVRGQRQRLLVNDEREVLRMDTQKAVRNTKTQLAARRS